jgi:hypothetical protein
MKNWTISSSDRLSTDEDEWKPESVDLSQGVDRKISMINRKRQFSTNCESDVMLMSVLEALTLNTQSIQAIDREAKGVVLETRHHAITPERLARMWGIGIEKAKDTLSVTTQIGIDKQYIHCTAGIEQIVLIYTFSDWKVNGIWTIWCQRGSL